jgi:hypothetical protein
MCVCVCVFVCVCLCDKYDTDLLDGLYAYGKKILKTAEL